MFQKKWGKVAPTIARRQKSAWQKCAQLKSTWPKRAKLRDTRHINTQIKGAHELSSANFLTNHLILLKKGQNPPKKTKTKKQNQ